MQHFQQLAALTNWSVNLACEEEESHAWQKKLQKLQEVREPWEQSQTVWLVKIDATGMDLPGARLQTRLPPVFTITESMAKQICLCHRVRLWRTQPQGSLRNPKQFSADDQGAERDACREQAMFVCVCADRDAELRQLCVLRPLLLAGSEWTAASLPTPC